MDINNFNKFKNPLNSNFTFKVQNKNMTFNNTNKMSLGFNSFNTLREKNFNVNELNNSINNNTHLENSINSFNVTKPKEEEIFKSNHFSSIDVMDDSGRNIIQTEMRNKGSNW